MFLEATNPEYLEGIYHGPYKRNKRFVVVGDEQQRMIPKENKDYTYEDISSISKDTKVRHLLHSALDNVIVISCRFAKAIRDALEVRCRGTKTIKKQEDYTHTRV